MKIVYEVTVTSDGDIFWRLNGGYHREDGPAVECKDGYKCWYINGKRHREDGPAIKRITGTEEWYLNGKLHRVDGPAIDYANGGKYWYLNGTKYTKEKYAKEIIRRKNSCDGKIVEIDGKKYKLTEAE